MRDGAFGETAIWRLSELKDGRGRCLKYVPSERMVCLYYIPQDPQDPESDLAANLGWLEMSMEKGIIE